MSACYNFSDVNIGIRICPCSKNECSHRQYGKHEDECTHFERFNDEKPLLILSIMQVLSIALTEY